MLMDVNITLRLRHELSSPPSPGISDRKTGAGDKNAEYAVRRAQIGDSSPDLFLQQFEALRLSHISAFDAFPAGREGYQSGSRRSGLSLCLQADDGRKGSLHGKTPGKPVFVVFQYCGTGEAGQQQYGSDRKIRFRKILHTPLQRMMLANLAAERRQQDIHPGPGGNGIPG